MKKRSSAPTKPSQKLQSVKKPGPRKSQAKDDHGLRPGGGRPGQTAFPQGQGKR